MDAFLAVTDFEAKAESTTGKMAEPFAAPTTVAIVIPVYKHSVLLGEAVESALAQRCLYNIKIVIVDDGCPFPETELIGMAYALSHREVVYLRKPNGGLSSARNHGIDYCLRAIPNLTAVYFLDADNRITPVMVQETMTALENSPGVDWVYPNIDKFGIQWAGNYNTPYSRLLHVSFDNICEAGSLVSRRLLDTGIRFDESMKSGFEDWDFWLQSIGAGFRGTNHPCFGFDYRQRAESMLRDSNRVRSAILSYIREKHRKLFAVDTLLRWEHEEVPRFSLVSVETYATSLFTDPTVAHETVGLEEFVRRYWAAVREPDTFGVPPFLIWMKDSHLKVLIDAGIAHNLLWLGERLSAEHHFVAFRLENDEARLEIDIRQISETEHFDKKPIGWMCSFEMLKACVNDTSDDWVRSLQHAIPSPKTVEIVVRGPFGSEVSRTALSATNALLATLGSLRDSGYFNREPSRWMWRSAYLPDRSKYHELLRNSVGAKPLIPRLSTPDGPIRIGFLLPIATFGGVEKVAYAIAKVLKRLGCELHLFVLGKSIYNRTSEAEGVFKTINFLADDYPLWDGPHNFAGHGLLMGDDPAAKTENVLGLLTGLDVIFNCQVAPVNAVLGELRRRGTKVLGHVHVLDKTGTGRDAGHPYLALAFEHAYDMILTCSEDMIYWLHSMGVPRAKLLHVANAPSYELPAEEVSTILKSRQARKPKALRALFMGRLDTQKGIERLYTAARELQQRDVVIDWQIIGSEVVSDNPEHSWTSRFEEIGIQIRPAIYAAEKLTDELSKADVLVLPSRWEGAPLTILEAQRLGCVPIATAVGAVSELINHGVDGVLLDASDDWGVACDLTAVLQRLASNREELARLSIGASSRAATVSWTTNIAPLVRQFEAWFPQRWNAMARECLSC